MKIEEAKKLRLQFGSQVHEDECIELYNKVIEGPPGPIVEVGSATGGSTIFLIAAAQEVGKMVYSIDTYPNMPGVYAAEKWKELFRKNILNGNYDNIIQYNEDVTKCIDKIPDGLSLVFIDGCHQYEFASNDFDLLFPKLVSDGWLYMHDARWKDGQASGKPNDGIIAVTNRICTPAFKNFTGVGVMEGGQKS